MLFFASLIAFVVVLKRSVRADRTSTRAKALAIGVPLGVALLALATAPRGYLLTKTLGAMAMPLGLVWCALAGFIALAYWRDRWRELPALCVVFVLFSLAGSGFVADLLGGSLERAYASDPFAEAPFDAVIVLGGGTDEAYGRIQLGASGDRVALGARLYHRGLAPRLVTTGSAIAGFSEHDAAAATERIWREMGVPAEAIVRLEGARTTSEEAVIHAREIRARGWRRVGLVSSAQHMPRALALFRERGARVVPLAADFRSDAPRWRGFHDLVPRGDAAARIHGACWERVGRLAGR
ncbi:MAG: YdcF family protein [Sandaracinaceae bacterium]|nr:MAG: YdcF family protein [Sandaracinaceae bacterium]